MRGRPERAGLSRNREPVIGIGPGGSLLRILARSVHQCAQRGELMTARLTHRRERLTVPGQFQDHFVLAASAIAARHGNHAEYRAVDAQ